MNNRIKAFASAAVLVMGLAGPAGAAHTPEGEVFAPEYVETPVFLHCTGSTKVGNINWIPDGSIARFDTTKPTASVTSGAGCAQAEWFSNGTANHNPLYDFPVAGTFTGNIKNITIRFWAVELAGSRALNEFTVDLHLQIDGNDILTRPTVVHAPAGGAGTDRARLYEVTVTNVGLDSAADHEMEHEIALTAYSKFVNGSGINLWVYDTSEFDSGLVFNDTTPAAVKVPRS